MLARGKAIIQESQDDGWENGIPNSVSDVRRTECTRRERLPCQICTCWRGAKVLSIGAAIRRHPAQPEVRPVRRAKGTMQSAMERMGSLNMLRAPASSAC